MANPNVIQHLETNLFDEISLLIEQGKSKAVAQVNSVMTLLYWKVGRRINHFLLENKRADYGKEIVVTLSRQLEKQYGRSFEEKNLRRMKLIKAIRNYH